MYARTRSGSLELDSALNPECRLIVSDETYGIRLIAVDRDTDQRVHVYLGSQRLDELEAEIRRIRTERGI